MYKDLVYFNSALAASALLILLLNPGDGVCALLPISPGGVFPIVCESKIRGISPDGGVSHLCHRNSNGLSPLHVNYP